MDSLKSNIKMIKAGSEITLMTRKELLKNGFQVIKADGEYQEYLRKESGQGKEFLLSVVYKNMKKFLGKTVHIYDLDIEWGRFRIKEDKADNLWTIDMIALPEK